MPGNREHISDTGAAAPLWTRRKFIAAAGLLPAAWLAAACSDDDDSEPQASATSEPPTSVIFMAGFKAQANLPFVGAYVAQEKGFFRDQNLDVEIRHAQSGEHLQLLLNNTVQFSTANGAQVLQRNDQDLHIVSLALIGQKSEQGFAVLADSGINSVKDMAGKTLGYKGSAVPAEFLALAKANGLDPASVKSVRVGFDVRVLTEKQVDILPVFFSNEPDTIGNLGFKTKIFDPNDYGIQSLGLTYITSREFLNGNAATAERFLRGALKGLEYANDHREEAVDIVLKYGPQEDRAHQAFMLNTEFDRAITDATRKNGLGFQTAQQWQSFADTLLEYQTLSKPANVASVFDDVLVRKLYKEGKLVWPG